MLRENPTPQQVNNLLFSLAAVLTPEHRERLYDYVKDARCSGNWKKTAQLTLEYIHNTMSINEE